MCEELEYSDLLDQAAQVADPHERMVRLYNVAKLILGKFQHHWELGQGYASENMSLVSLNQVQEVLDDIPSLLYWRALLSILPFRFVISYDI